MQPTTAACPSVKYVIEKVVGSQAMKAMIASLVEMRPEGSGRVLQRSTYLSKLRSQISL
jgi:hypothetical protein